MTDKIRDATRKVRELVDTGRVSISASAADKPNRFYREPPPPEHEAARAWRDAAGLSRARLAELTGYSAGTISALERGEWGKGRPIEPRTMTAYRLACAALAGRLHLLTWQDMAKMEEER